MIIQRSSADTTINTSPFMRSKLQIIDSPFFTPRNSTTASGIVVRREEDPLRLGCTVDFKTPTSSHLKNPQPNITYTIPYTNSLIKCPTHIPTEGKKK